MRCEAPHVRLLLSSGALFCHGEQLGVPSWNPPWVKGFNYAYTIGDVFFGNWVSGAILQLVSEEG